VLASLAMGVVLLVLAALLAPSFGRAAAMPERTLALITLVAAGAATYGLAVFALGAVEIRQLVALLRPRRPAAEDS